MDTQAYLLLGLLIAVVVFGPFLLRVLFNKTGDAVVNKYRESTNKTVNQANAAAGPQRLADRYPGFVESLPGYVPKAAAATAVATATPEAAVTASKATAAPAYVSPTAQPPAPPLSSLRENKPAAQPAPAQQWMPYQEVEPAVSATPAAQATPATMFCMYCGKQISTEALFCPYCGKKQD